MKKEILIIFMFLGLCFSQTGMMTDKGESGFGIWVEANGDVECEYNYLTGNEYCDQTTVLSLDYMFSFGLELGVDYGVWEILLGYRINRFEHRDFENLGGTLNISGNHWTLGIGRGF